MKLKPIRKLIDADLKVVESLIRTSLSSQVNLTQQIGEYVVSAGGKRIRAILTILAAKSLGYCGTMHHLLAAVIEIIHTATLLHDDVVDASDMRRGHPSANAVYGNMAAVLCGDFLYSKAFELMIELEHIEILAMLAKTSNTLAEGEMLQLQSCHNPELTEQQYLKVIQQKTAGLFEAACEIPCMLKENYLCHQEALQEYGKNIGFAFQIIDDALDYSSDTKVMGKNPGDDLAEGKMTLPLIYALQNCKAADQDFITNTIKNGDITQLEKIKFLIAQSGALDYTLKKAQDFAKKAQNNLKDLPASPYKDALIELAQQSVNRDH